jgi:hypothetical protein
MGHCEWVVGIIMRIEMRMSLMSMRKEINQNQRVKEIDKFEWFQAFFLHIIFSSTKPFSKI